MLTAEANQNQVPSNSVTSTIARLHAAQKSWANQSVTHRLIVIKKLRHALVKNAERLSALINLPQRRFLAEHLASDIIPVADACRFLERNAKRIMGSRNTRWRDRPAWGLGLNVSSHREPLGVVLVIGTWNYPLLLTGVQLLQALVAGNAVLIKPGDGMLELTECFVDLLRTSGLPSELVHVLPEDPTQCKEAMSIGGPNGVNKVVFTGSAETGKRVLAQLAETATPSVMELSGSDAMFVLPGADLERAAKCLVFGLRLNGSSTCIAPRRVFVPRDSIRQFGEHLQRLLPTGMSAPVHPKAGELAAELIGGAIDDGATLLAPNEWLGWKSGEAFPTTVLEFEQPEAELLRKDVFVPVASLIPVTDVEEALELDQSCPYALGASVFGEARDAAKIARRIDAGCVVVNDMVAPTADPRLPFGGRHASGFGMTRGAEGLLEMTQVKAIVTQTSRFLPHLDEPIHELGDVLKEFLSLNHGETWLDRWKALVRLPGAGRAYWTAMKNKRENSERGE